MMPATPEPTIRGAVEADAAEISRLLTMLGHATTAEQVRARWGAWEAEGNAALVAAAPDGRLLGLATLHRTAVLHRPRPVGRVTALVVDAAVRGQGIGRTLMAAAERWLAGAGCGMVEITSNVRRTDAHAFYERLGYAHTGRRFVKQPL